MRNLWPPICVIESRLIPGKAGIEHFPDLPEQNSDTDTAPAEMPAFIQDKVRKRIASQAANFDPQPAAGKIVRFDGDNTEAVPMCVLLDQERKPGIWQGWIVASETDYASDKDVLLEPLDEPFDPIASMVQTWNPVEVDASKSARVLAQLSLDRMAAIREVAASECESAGEAKAGFVAPLKTKAGRTVLVGTCIKALGDLRNEYQSLYRAAAKRLQECHQTIAEVIPYPAKKQNRDVWKWAMAASVLLAQSIIIANLLRDHLVAQVSKEMEQASEYRAVVIPEDGYVYVDVYFKPDARVIDIQKLLTKLDAVIIDGPGEFGQWRVKIRSVDSALKTLKESSTVESMKLVDGPGNQGNAETR